MIKITLLSPGIEIGGIVFPSNSLIFSLENSPIVDISLATSNKKLFSAHYNSFLNSSDIQYASAQAVINDLLLNNTA